MSRMNSESDTEMKIGIVTMFSGENEIDIQKSSLDCQQGVDLEQALIKGLSEVDAHSAFRGIVEDDQLQAALYVKLDGDMAFVDTSALSRIAAFFEAEPGLCHLVVPVQDWPSNGPIYGAHAYRVGVKFPYGGTALSTDPNPRINGTRRTLEIHHEPFISHMADPSESQCYLLGYHRALKVVQKGSWIKDFKNARFQLDYLEKISTANMIEPDSRRDCILLGAYAVLAGGVSARTFEKSDATYGKILAMYAFPEVRARGLKSTAPGALRFRYWKLRYCLLPRLWSVPGLYLYRMAYKVWSTVRRMGMAGA